MLLLDFRWPAADNKFMKFFKWLRVGIGIACLLAIASAKIYAKPPADVYFLPGLEAKNIPQSLRESKKIIYLIQRVERLPETENVKHYPLRDVLYNELRYLAQSA